MLGDTFPIDVRGKKQLFRVPPQLHYSIIRCLFSPKFISFKVEANKVKEKIKKERLYVVKISTVNRYRRPKSGVL